MAIGAAGYIILIASRNYALSYFATCARTRLPYRGRVVLTTLQTWPRRASIRSSASPLPLASSSNRSRSCGHAANTIAWTANITEGSYKRAFVMGVVIGWGNVSSSRPSGRRCKRSYGERGQVNGAVSSNIYRAVDKPWYRLGHGLVLMYIGIGFVSTVILLVLLKRENRRRDQGLCDEAIGGDEGEARQAGKLWFATVEDAVRGLLLDLLCGCPG